MGHYFEENPQTAHNRKEISFRFSSVNYTFMTDSNLFSKDKVDTGTQILLDAVVKHGTGKKVLDLGCGTGTLTLALAFEMITAPSAAAAAAPPKGGALGLTSNTYELLTSHFRGRGTVRRRWKGLKRPRVTRSFVCDLD